MSKDRELTVSFASVSEVHARRMAVWEDMRHHLGIDPAKPGSDKTVMVSWIDRDAAKRDPRVRLELEVTAHRRAVESAGVLERIITPQPTNRLPKPGSRPTLPHPRLTGRELRRARLRELQRLADGTPAMWTCSIRAELLAEGLVEITTQEDGRWAGDRITTKGCALLSSTKRAER